MQKTQDAVRSLDQEGPLEKEMAIHSSILAWKIPWTEEPGGLQSAHRVANSQTGLITHLTLVIFIYSLQEVTSCFPDHSYPLLGNAEFWSSLLAPSTL